MVVAGAIGVTSVAQAAAADDPQVTLKQMDDLIVLHARNFEPGASLAIEVEATGASAKAAVDLNSDGRAVAAFIVPDGLSGTVAFTSSDGTTSVKSSIQLTTQTTPAPGPEPAPAPETPKPAPEPSAPTPEVETPEAPAPPPAPTGNVLWRADLSKGLAGLAAADMVNKSFAEVLVAGDSPDPSGNIYRINVAKGSSDSNPKFATTFEDIGIGSQSEVTASMDIRFNGAAALASGPSKQAWGLGQVPAGGSVWDVSSGGNKTPNSWSARYTTAPANRLAYKFGDHPMTMVAYIYAESAGGWTPQTSTKGYGIEIPFRDGLGNGKSGEFYDLSKNLDQWIHLDLRVKMNTAGQANGEIEMKADGKTWVLVKDVKFNAGDADATINAIVSHTFFNDAVPGAATIDHANLEIRG